MNSLYLLKIPVSRRRPGFTLVEMLVVIAIMSILMTAGAIGLSGMTGKGVTSGVATAEGLFEEARTIAISKGLRTCVLIAKDIPANGSDNLRRILVATENYAADTGIAKDPLNPTPDWVITGRGAVLPDQTFFSKDFSKLDHTTGSGNIPTVLSSKIKSAPSTTSTAPPTEAKANYLGEYYIYQFNSEGICSNPGTSFVIGAGSRSPSTPTASPKLTSSAKRDFGGFAVWSNGRTSSFRSPEQISSNIKSLNSGAAF